MGIWKAIVRKKKERSFERTWLEGDAVLRTDLKKKVLNLKRSDVLADLDIIDMKKLKPMIDLWCEGKIQGGQTFTVLLTLESFLSKNETSGLN